MCQLVDVSTEAQLCPCMLYDVWSLPECEQLWQRAMLGWSLGVCVVSVHLFEDWLGIRGFVRSRSGFFRVLLFGSLRKTNIVRRFSLF